MGRAKIISISRKTKIVLKKHNSNNYISDLIKTKVKVETEYLSRIGLDFLLLDDPPIRFDKDLKELSFCPQDIDGEDKFEVEWKVKKVRQFQSPTIVLIKIMTKDMDSPDVTRFRRKNITIEVQDEAS
ncbi:MAG: hypothetical protein KAT34_19655 [Candidatus Aminicenantes bacterium]|nr:hypothetical protein [Candidatus Aminicenantes bacterium]